MVDYIKSHTKSINKFDKIISEASLLFEVDWSRDKYNFWVNNEKFVIGNTGVINGRGEDSFAYEIFDAIFDFQNGKPVERPDWWTANPGLKWLKNATFVANNLLLSDTNAPTSDPVSFDDKRILFRGKWMSGVFKGVMLNSSEMIGGVFDGAEYITSSNAFMQDEDIFDRPKHFLGGKWLTNDGALGMPFVDVNTDITEATALIQAKLGQIVTIYDNLDNKYHIQVIKNVDNSSADFVLKNLHDEHEMDFAWDTYRNNIETIIVRPGNRFIIPDFIETSGQVTKIKVLPADMEETVTSTFYTAPTDEEAPEGTKHIRISGVNPLLSLTSYITPVDDSGSEELEKIKRHIANGSFSRWMETIKQEVTYGASGHGGINGYGSNDEFDGLKKLWNVEGNFTLTSRRLELLKYLNSFIENVVIRISNIRGRLSLDKQRDYLSKLKQYLYADVPPEAQTDQAEPQQPERPEPVATEGFRHFVRKLIH